MVAFWFCFCSTFGTLASINFVVSLTNNLDSDYFTSQSTIAKQTRQVLLSSIYLILVFFVLNVLLSFALRKPVKVWIYMLYGVIIPEYYQLFKVQAGSDNQTTEQLQENNPDSQVSQANNESNNSNNLRILHLFLLEKALIS